MKQNKVALKNFTESEMKEFMATIGEKAFRGSQIFSWIYKGAKTFDDMNNIPKSLRNKLEEVSYIGNLNMELKLESKKDGTKKYLFELNDGNIIETVMMDYESRVTVCISNQVGCRMGCRFCASTIDGLVRNLEPWEILDQIMKIQEDTGKRVSNLVLMGSGEPLDNFENTTIDSKAVSLVDSGQNLTIYVNQIDDSQNLLETANNLLANNDSITSNQTLDINGVTVYFLYAEGPGSYNADIYFNKNGHNYLISGDNITYDGSDYFINNCKSTIFIFF